jgi:hypothetical protein
MNIHTLHNSLQRLNYIIYYNINIVIIILYSYMYLVKHVIIMLLINFLSQDYL